MNEQTEIDRNKQTSIISVFTYLSQFKSVYIYFSLFISIIISMNICIKNTTKLIERDRYEQTELGR